MDNPPVLSSHHHPGQGHFYMNTVPRDLTIVLCLQFISAMITIPLSVLLLVQKGALVVLGGGFQASERVDANFSFVANISLTVLAALTLALGFLTLYLSIHLVQNYGQRLLQATAIAQGVLLAAELAKFGFGSRGNLITVFCALTILLYLYKPLVKQGLTDLRQGQWKWFRPNRPQPMAATPDAALSVEAPPESLPVESRD